MMPLPMNQALGQNLIALSKKSALEPMSNSGGDNRVFLFPRIDPACGLVTQSWQKSGRVGTPKKPGVEPSFI